MERVFDLCLFVDGGRLRRDRGFAGSPLDVRVEPIGYGELSTDAQTIDRPGYPPSVPVGPIVCRGYGTRV